MSCAIAARKRINQFSGGATCLTRLVEHMCSSEIAKNTANSIGRIRQVMPQKTNEAVVDKQCTVVVQWDSRTAGQ